ncbi:tripartite tricarboxylate transporter substrate binding protein [Alkalihalobacillus oceani]|uniref:Tripartite tricarboxylate transporter substrate binding protein n=1 Tax=Halalkalibacter oceani TaxID=1653776 RepID=A0A9X2DSV2_9BACI|nr:tripartite tricarboxylate transporter substrate binding protein [Halalkalibacter oceani]MCM3716501.1 tripartite tricarboxylate transporter substrate binding protein [Halalkalibacter oceani]
MNIKHFKLGAVIIFALLLIAGCGSGEEEVSGEGAGDFPNSTINLSVPFSAGGSGDIMVREIARIMSEDLGIEQSIVVENRDGGSGAVAINHMLGQPADGYTLLNQSSTAPLTMASGGLEFGPEELAPIASMVSNYQTLSVLADSPFETIDDLIEAAKENPGSINVGSSQTYGANHVFLLKFMREADIDLNYIAYDGGGEALTSLLGGNTDVLASSGEVVQEQVAAGEVRMLAISSAERVEDHPDVPTFAELGMASLEDELIWRAFFVHPDTPEEIQERWAEILKEVSETDRFKEYAENTNQDIYFTSGEEFKEIYYNYYETAKELFDALN